MANYDFSSGLASLNQGIAALGRGMRDAYEWEQGEKLAAQIFGGAPQPSQQSLAPLAALGQPRGGAEQAPQDAGLPALGAQYAQASGSPGQASRPMGANIAPEMRTVISQMVRNPETRAQGLQLWQQAMRGPEVKTLDLGGAIGIMDNQGNILRQIRKTASPGSGSGEYGLQPVYGTDANGNPVIMQIGKNGSAIQTALPQGVSLSKEPIKLDAGTHHVLIDPISRQQVGMIPKNIAQAETERAIGQAQGEAVNNLPSTIAQSENMLRTIEGIEKDPNLSWGTGKTSWTTSIPGTGMYDFGRKVAQLQGQAFLQAFNSLKGGGAITEVEGQKAENAIARLSTSQTEEGFKAALNELKGVINAGIERAKQRAGQGGSAATPSRADLEAEARRRGLIR